MKFLTKYLNKFSRLNRGLRWGAGAVLFGLILGAFSLMATWQAQHSAAKPVSQLLNGDSNIDKPPLITGRPVRVQVPSVGIDLKVLPGYYYSSTKSWSLSLNDAQWGVMTAKPNNQEGVTFIYAHYRWGVFYNLPHVQPGAEAIITTDNGRKFSYKFRASQVTSPSDTTLFTYTGKPVLIMQTCTGLWYQNRQLFAFDFKKVT
jgi:hypothetical protein